MSYAPSQLANARKVLGAVRARRLDRVAEQQALACVLVECTLRNYANPLYPWTLDGSDGYPPRSLAPSTKESCGMFQQRPRIPQWWGPQGLSIRDQSLYFMDIPQATDLFLDRLVGTIRTNEPWCQIQEVQRSEYDGRPGYPYAANYLAQWAAAGALIDQLDSIGGAVGSAITGTLIDWITGMVTTEDQAQLAAFKADVVAGVVKALTEGQSSELFLNRVYYSGQAENRGQDTANKAATADSASSITSRVDHQDYPRNMFLAGMDEKSANNGEAIVAIAKQAAADATRAAAGVAGLAAQLADIVATLAAQDAVTKAATTAAE